MNIFGTQVRKLKDEYERGLTFVAPTKEDGAIEIDSNENYFGYSANQEYVLNLDEIPSDEMELTYVYRNMALNHDIDSAIQEIVNEAIITDNLNASVAIVLDDVDLSDALKDKIRDEFEAVLKLLNFKNDGFGLFRKWYIDGKLYFHKVINKNNTQTGVTALIPIEPLHIKLIRETKRQVGVLDFDTYDLKDTEEYFIYSRKPFESDRMKYDKSVAVKIPKEAITYVTSGLMSSDGKLVLSQLYKAIKTFNNLRMMEDALVIYRVSRAPERRVFYVDVGSLPSGKANQYLKDVMDKFKTKVTYDVAKGTITNRKNFQSMMEDYWLPRREGGRGTEVSTLPGGENLSELGDIDYFKKKLYDSLNVPLSRFQADGSNAMFSLGRTTEITRDEIRFNKFIGRLRNKFSEIFDDILKSQLILKKIVSKDEWMKINQDISYSFLEDNYFTELKELEVMQERINAYQAVQNVGIVGKYISHETVRRDILKQTEDEMREEDKKIKEEESNKQYNPDDEESQF